jgi:RHS repeat-associated protein
LVVFRYDANSDDSSGYGRSIVYTTFDPPSQISDGHVTSFNDGPDRSSYRRIDNGTAGTTTTRYVGSVEIIFKPNGDQDRKRYIAGVAVETVHFGDNAIEDYRETQYLHKDHLGSLNAITDDQGELLQDLAFDAWGERRNPDSWGPYTDPQLIAFDHSRTTRGFTGHEMLDEVGIVHMNGRIYDPKLGRFLQADPFVQEPTNTQSLNRYSYVFNNPLNATDPSGYFLDFIAYAVMGAIIGKIGQDLDLPVLSALGNIVVCGSTGGLGCASTFAFASTVGAGGSFNDAFKNGLFAGLSAAAFSGIGDAFDGTGFWAQGGAGHIGAHAVAGGILSELQGGKFGHGFLSAALTKAVNLNRILPGSNRQIDMSRTVAAAIIGGSISKVTGGKFANGAITGAFAQAYNGNEEERERIRKETEVEVRVLIADIFELSTDFSSIEAAIKNNKAIEVKINQDGSGVITTRSGKRILFDADQLLNGTGLKGKYLSLDLTLESEGYIRFKGTVKSPIRIWGTEISVAWGVGIEVNSAMENNSGLLGQAVRSYTSRREQLDQQICKAETGRCE